MNSHPRRLASTYPYSTPWFRTREDTVQLPDGSETTFYVVECPASVFIVPITRDNTVILVKLFRYRTRHKGWEVPAGTLEEGETPLQCAARELTEETGLRAKQLTELTPTFDSMNGISDNAGHVFIATGLTETDSNKQDEEGITNTRAFSWGEIFAMISNGQIVDALSIAALMKYYAASELTT